MSEKGSWALYLPFHKGEGNSCCKFSLRTRIPSNTKDFSSSWILIFVLSALHYLTRVLDSKSNFTKWHLSSHY
jgi:hypothetical protein